jgi:periplasmic protein TonB
MFQQTFVPEAPSARKPIGIAVSVTLQFFALALLALVPLFFRQPEPSVHLHLLFLGPRPAMVPEKPIAKTSPLPTTRVPLRMFRLTAPVAIPSQINVIPPDASTAPDVGNVVPSGREGEESLLQGFVTVPSVVPPEPREEPKRKQPPGPLAIGGNVAAANLIYRVEPVYPTLAKISRVQGIVVFQAIIGTDGRIRDLQLNEGHPLLIDAAKNSILQWRYRPTLLNGKPVEVSTVITVRFNLSQ